MKLLLSALLLKSSLAFAAAPQFVELNADKVNYQVGDQAVLTATIITKPDNPTMEIFLEGQLGGSPIKLTRITEDISSAVTPVLSSGGTLEFEVKAYLQDKRLARDTAIAEVGLRRELCDLQEKLKSETNPTKRDLLQSVIARDEETLVSLQENLLSHRLLVETKMLSLQILSGEGRIVPAHPALLLEADHADKTYQFGETAVLSTHIYSEYLPREIRLEAIVTAKFDGINLRGIPGDTVDHFSFSKEFTDSDDSGAHEVTATLWIRDKNRADKLRAAILQAEARRAGQIALRDGVEDSDLKTYYQTEIDDLTKIIDTYYMVLEGIKIPIGETHLSLTLLPKANTK